MMNTRRIRVSIVALSLLAAPCVALSQPAAELRAQVAEGLQAQVIAQWGRDAQDERDPRATDESWRRQVVRLGNNYELAADDAVREVFVMGGSATISGYVNSDVVVVFGTLNLTSTAVVGGSVVSVGGDAVIADGARVRRDLVSVLGHVAAPPTFSPGGGHVMIDPRFLGSWVDPLITWFMRGPLWGRLIVPGLAWVWAMVAVFVFLHLLVGQFAYGPVRAAAETLAAKPFSSLLVGLAALILVGPVCVLLGVSVVGIVAIPFVLVGLLIAGIVGRVAVVRWLGGSFLPETDAEDRLQSLRSLAIGLVALTLVYMVPVLGVLTWVSVGVFGLGATALAFIAGYRRENPAPIRPTRPRDTPLPIPAPPGSSPGSAAAANFSPLADTGEAPGQGGAMPMTDPLSIPLASPSPASVAAVDMTLFPKAAFMERAAAGLLDLILLAVSFQILDLFDSNEESFFLFILLYLIGFITWKGTTLGGIICQLRVVRVDSQPLRFVDALVRELSAIFSLIVVGLGFFWIVRDADRQAWHDKIAGTYVVKVPRNWPL